MSLNCNIIQGKDPLTYQILDWVYRIAIRNYLNILPNLTSIKKNILN